MAFFELNSDITIGNFRFTGVHEVMIKRSLHSISETATIKLPSKTSIIKSDRSIKKDVVTGAQFKEGDPVEIRLGYNGELRTEFRGFVKKRNMDKPLVVECEGYSFRLRDITLDKFAFNIKVKDLLELAVEDPSGNTKVTVRCDTNLKLESMQIKHMNITALVTALSDAMDGSLTCFFIEPDVLWCGLPYTSLAKGEDPFGLGTASYQLDYNTIDNKEIKLNLHAGATKLKVSYSAKVEGKKKTYVSDAYKSTTKEHKKVLNQPMASSLKALANEKAYREGYVGYEGKIYTFLEPYAAPGFIVDMISEKHKDQNGKYLVVGTEVKFGVEGARRTVELGPKLESQNVKQ